MHWELLTLRAAVCSFFSNTVHNMHPFKVSLPLPSAQAHGHGDTAPLAKAKGHSRSQQGSLQNAPEADRSTSRRSRFVAYLYVIEQYQEVRQTACFLLP